jgi:hypothetical protein
MTEPSTEFIEIERMSVDQLAGAFVMIAGAIGSLLLVIWQSKCHCKMNLCYIFSCERRPPNEDEMKSLKDQAKKLKEKKDEEKKDEKKKDTSDNETPQLLPKSNSNLNLETVDLDNP